MVRVNDRAIDVGKNLELIGHAQVVSVTGHAAGNDSLAHLLFRGPINHVVLLRHAPDPAVTLTHETLVGIGNWAICNWQFCAGIETRMTGVSITNYKSPIANLLVLMLPYYEIGPPVDNPRYLP
jgi:hypothetical protein